MCRFFSAIIKNVSEESAGFELLYNPWTDSHEDLVRLFKLNDTATKSGEPRFARIEFLPDKPEDMAEPELYKLTIDEARRPEWFTAEKEAKVVARLKLVIASMVIRGDADLICGGAYILAKDARISTVKNARIAVMLGSSKVGEMWESSNVGVMWGSSKVGEMRESSNVGVMRESSNVGVMRGSSKVGEMRGSSKVGEMRGSSNVGVMWESSNVGVMRGSSKVGEDKRTEKTNA